MINRFIPDVHYVLGHDHLIDAPFVFLLHPSRYLCSQYYAEKYRANIIFVANDIELRLVLARLNKTNPNDRIGFLVGKINQRSVPIVYLRENHEEGLLYLDAQGHNPEVLKKLKRCNLTIYSVKQPRQADSYSCVVDALVFVRDCTAKNKSSNNYRVSNLLHRLKLRSQILDTHVEVKLPDELLKTSQSSVFVQTHREKVRFFIHKKETLSHFRERYSFAGPDGKIMSSYLRLKGLAMVDRAEIQFYLNELKAAIPQQWTEVLKNEFIRQAKFEFLQQGDIFLNPHRSGLHYLAIKFFNKVRDNQAESLFFEMSSVNQVDKIKKIAEVLLDIIQDVDYWKQKTYFRFCVPRGIALMQDKLRALGENSSLIAKIHTVRAVILERKETKSMLYLFLGIEDRDIATANVYKIFLEDWSTTSLFEKIYADWQCFKNAPSKSLASMEMYNHVRIRF